MTPIQNPYAGPTIPQPSRFPRYLLIGCGSLLGLLLIGGIATYFLFWTAVDRILVGFTTDRPLTIPHIQMDEATYTALEERIRDFGSAMEGEAPATPLVLTAEEINVLILRHSKLDNDGAGAVVRILGSQVEAEISIPVGNVLKGLEGRYLNGKAVLAVGVVEERLVAYIQDLRIGDKYLPDQFRERLSRENLLRNAYEKDSDLSNVLSRIRSVEVRDGAIVLTPASRGK